MFLLEKTTDPVQIDSQILPNARSDGFCLSSRTERNVIKYQGHRDTVSGLHILRFEISADSDVMWYNNCLLSKMKHLTVLLPDKTLVRKEAG